MSDIPVELLLAILGCIEDTAVLFNLHIAQSVDGLACIQAGGTDTLNSVQEIIFEAAGDRYGQEGDPLQVDTAFSGLAKFRNLRIVHRARCPPTTPLISLTLYNIIPIPDGIYATEAFQNIFRSLTTLCISVDSGNQPQLSDFWESSIPSILKSATNLTSLTIRSNHPSLTFTSPMLASLMLDTFILHPAHADYDIAEFIVRHKATLMHLELTDCWVLRGKQGVYARPWRSLFQLFQQELVGLRSLRMLTTISGSYLWHFCGYIVLVPESRFFYYDHEAAVQARDLDDAAFESLISTVELRARSRI
ncbi:hypothetical protein B0H14DRAFT_2727583 [Mycena olivaceomarginata]|nr:hypothetical protein B0H14DRAFT_2727583 [Mycena olivaceomarginata]